MSWTTLILLLVAVTVVLAAVDYPTRNNQQSVDDDGRPARRNHRRGHRDHHRQGRHDNGRGQHHGATRGRHGRGHGRHVARSANAMGDLPWAESIAVPVQPAGFDWGYFFGGGGGPWWRGENICENRHETIVNLTNTQNDVDGAPITHHYFFTRSSCDETNTAYTCTTVANIFGIKKTVTVTLECCHGYEREKNKPGCPVRVPLRPMLDTMMALGAGEMARGMSSMGLNALLEEGNFTVFAPKDMAFKNLMVQPDQTSQENVVVITPKIRGIVGNVQQVLMAHMVPGIMRTGVFSDELLLLTSNPKAKIRINVYDTPKQLLTANCIPIEQADKMAENGVVHLTQGLLPTAENTVADIISKDPQLSTLKTMLGRLGIVQALRADGQYTLFAPINAAFNKIKPSLLNKLLFGDSCLGMLVRTHLLPNVICSSIIIGKVKTRNVLSNYVNLTRDADDKIWLGHAQIITRDVMASNGVVHLIDNVLIPDDVLDILEVAEKVGATEFVELVKHAGLTKTFETSENVTLFLPSNYAIKSLPEEELAALKADPEALSSLVKYHMTPGLVRSGLIGHNQRLNTLNGKAISVKEFFSAPFGIRRETTAQCARISHRDLETCNGVVHIVDKVLVPPRGDVLDTLSQMSNMSTLVGLLKYSGLADSFQSTGPYTFLAPSNKAWAAVDDETMAGLRARQERLQGLLKSHITPGTICCAGMFHQRMVFKQRERMLDSSMLRFDSDGDGNAQVGGQTPIIRCDVTATNGVVHVIDEVLPAAIRKYTRLQEIGRGGGDSEDEEEVGIRGRFKNFFTGNWHIERPNFGPFYESVNMHWDAFLRRMQNMRHYMSIDQVRLRFGSKKK